MRTKALIDICCNNEGWIHAGDIFEVVNARDFNRSVVELLREGGKETYLVNLDIYKEFFIRLDNK